MSEHLSGSRHKLVDRVLGTAAITSGAAEISAALPLYEYGPRPLSAGLLAVGALSITIGKHWWIKSFHPYMPEVDAGLDIFDDPTFSA